MTYPLSVMVASMRIIPPRQAPRDTDFYGPDTHLRTRHESR